MCKSSAILCKLRAAYLGENNMRDKKALNVAIGNRIRISREKSGLTQEELAEKLDLSTQFISTIERGVAGASLETVINLCDTLHVSSEWLLRGLTVAPSADSIVSKLMLLTPAQLSAVDRLTDELITLLRISSGQQFER